MFSKNIYSTKKLRKMCLRACNTRTVIFHEMCTSYAYEVSFYLSNECLFETIALIEAWKINVEVDLSCPPFSQNIVLFVYHFSHNNHISIDKFSHEQLYNAQTDESRHVLKHCEHQCHR